MQENELVASIFRDLEQLHRDIDENAKVIQRFAATFREHIVTPEGAKFSDFLEGIASSLRDRVLHVERVRQRIRADLH